MKQKIIIIILTVILTLTIFIPNIYAENIFKKEGIFLSMGEPEKGDILFCDSKSNLIGARFGGTNDHCALYIGKNTAGEDEFIHSIPVLGVVIWDKQKMEQYFTNMIYATVCSVYRDEDDINNVTSWALEREGDLYQFDYNHQANPSPEDDNDLYSECWHCAELIWAAYFNQGIDLSDGLWSYGHSLYIDELLRSTKLIKENIPPSAKFDVDYSPYKYDGCIILDACGSVDSDSNNDDCTYRWDWTNDGTWDLEGSVYEAQLGIYCEYEEGKTYTAKLEFEDVHGATDTATKTFTVGKDDSNTKTSYSVFANFLLNLFKLLQKQLVQHMNLFKLQNFN